MADDDQSTNPLGDTDADLDALAAAIGADGASEPAASNPTDDVEQAIDDLDALLNEASFEDVVSNDPPPAATPTRAAPAPAASEGTVSLDLPQFDKVLQEAQVSGIDLLRDVNLDVKIELGRSRMLVEDVLKLVEGSVVELDKLAGDPVDVFVNERLVARGEVLVLNENFCVRVNEIVQRSKEEDL